MLFTTRTIDDPLAIDVGDNQSETGITHLLFVTSPSCGSLRHHLVSSQVLLRRILALNFRLNGFHVSIFGLLLSIIIVFLRRLLYFLGVKNHQYYATW